jgi:hypothetical protein
LQRHLIISNLMGNCQLKRHITHPAGTVRERRKRGLTAMGERNNQPRERVEDPGYRALPSSSFVAAATADTTAASIPLALYEAAEQGRVWPGALVCLAAFGAGFTWASALMRW